MSQLEPPVSVLPGLAPVIEISKWSGLETGDHPAAATGTAVMHSIDG